MADIEELNVQFDPFADVEDNKKQENRNIHLRVQQRNGKKAVTTFQGLPQEYDSKKLLKVFKREFACSGKLIKDEELGDVLQFAGDQRMKIAEFLVNEKIVKKADIKIHGF